MRDFKRRKVRAELLHYLKKILSESGQKFVVINDKNGTLLGTELSSREFHRLIEEATCMEQQGDSRIPVCSKHMIFSGNTPNVYHILKRDQEAVRRAFW